MDLKSYYDRLFNFDWFYAMSDDGRVYRNGEEGMTRLKAEARKEEERTKLFNEMQAHFCFMGEPKDRPAMPERPDDIVKILTGEDHHSDEEHDAFVEWIHELLSFEYWEGDADGIYFYKDGNADNPYDVIHPYRVPAGDTLIVRDGTLHHRPKGKRWLRKIMDLPEPTEADQGLTPIPEGYDEQ